MAEIGTTESKTPKRKSRTMKSFTLPSPSTQGNDPSSCHEPAMTLEKSPTTPSNGPVLVNTSQNPSSVYDNLERQGTLTAQVEMISPLYPKVTLRQSNELSERTSEPVSVDDDRRNVVFFGDTGVGKSSVINMFREGTNHLGSEVPISSGAVGCTFASKGYQADLNGVRYMLWDTAGLNEGERGTVTHRESVENLAMLLHNLGGKIHLLVYCIRGKRFRQVIKDNYELFYKRFCGSQVPIVVAVTGLENEEPDMKSWWKQNSYEFSRYGLTFDGHACITATRGKAMKGGGYMFDEEYEESQTRVRLLITSYCSETGASVLDMQHDYGLGITSQDQGMAGFSKSGDIAPVAEYDGGGGEYQRPGGGHKHGEPGVLGWVVQQVVQRVISFLI